MQKLTLPSCVRPAPAPTPETLLTFEEALDLMDVTMELHHEGKLSLDDVLVAVEVLVAVTPKR